MNRVVILNNILLSLLLIPGCAKRFNYYDNPTPVVYSPYINVMYENFWNERYPDWKEEYEYDPLVTDHFIYLGSIEVDDTTSYYVVYYDYSLHTKAGGKDGGPRGTRGVQHALFFDNNYNYLGYSYDTSGDLRKYEIDENKLTLFCDQKVDVYFTETQIYAINGKKRDTIYEAAGE